MFITILEPCQRIKKFRECAVLPDFIRKMIKNGDFEVLRFRCDCYEHCKKPEKVEVKNV